MAKIKTYKDLIVWQKSMKLALLIYDIARNLPKEELYGLSMQMRKAVVSIPSNMAEGYGRRSGVEYRRFLNIAMGSLFELETQLLLARSLGFVEDKACREAAGAIDEIERMLRALIDKLPRSLSA